MHLRKLVGVCGFAVALLANYASALGLGEIKLNSALNQPLDAEIKLLDIRDLSAEQIIVALGSPADFERNGVDRLYFYTELEFQVLLNEPGGAVVRISTRNPVREPYLNFLVEARWPSGRLLREYTLLMDLPTFADTPSTPVESATTYPQPMTQPRTSTTVQTPTRSSSPAYPQAESRPEPESTPGGRRSAADSYGPVGSNETLWQIALDVRPERGLSVHQTMLAIQRLNPEAFINGNINLLRKGQVLRLPSADEIRSISRSDAVAEVAVQNQEWSGSTMGAQLNASRREVSTRRESQDVSGQVRLASPGSDYDGSGQGSGSNAGDSRGLENELAATLEELDKARMENSELNSRIQDLEEQIDTMERLVDVSNEQLRAMQLAAQQSTAEQPAAETTDTPETTQPSEAMPEEPVVDAPVTDVVPEPIVEPEVETPAPQAEPEQAKPAPAPVNPNRVVQSAPKPKTLVDHIVDNAIWIGVGLLVLLLAAYALIRRRNEQAMEEEATQDDDLFSMPPADEEAYNEEYQEEYPGDAEEEMPLFDEDDVPAEAETGDAVAEADIYIAYGKFDQAEEMLLNALSREPSSVPIRMKLLEVYSQTENVDKFDQHYASLLGDANHAELQRAAELRESIPGAGDFDSGLDLSPQEGIDLASSDDTLDFGLDDDLYSESPKAEKASGSAADDDFSFDLDLEEESPESLSLGETLSRESDVGSATTRYDLSFDEPQDTDAISEEDEFTLELDDDFSTAAADEAEQKEEKTTLDDDLGELSFELEDETPVTKTTASSTAVEDDDFSFDFEESETSLTEDELSFDEAAIDEAAFEETLAEEDVKREEKPSSSLEMADDNADDFNPDMDMSDLDLEALDHEMESLDAEFGESDDKAFADLDAQLELDDKQSALKAGDIPDADDDMFEQALSELPDQDTEAMPELSPISEADMDAELDFLADTDEAATKLDLARAYIDMGDTDGARDILAEVVQEGNAQQREEAEGLLTRIDV